MRLQGVYAHGVCLTDDELKLMAKQGSAIAHCPLSNMFFADRLLRYKCLLDESQGSFGPSLAPGCITPALLIRSILNARFVYYAYNLLTAGISPSVAQHCEMCKMQITCKRRLN